MQINQQSLTSVFQGLKTIFNEALEAADDEVIEELMTTVPSSNSGEDYPVGALLGDLEEVLDEVTTTNIGTYLASVENRTFARAVKVRRNDISDDNVGVYKPSVQALGDKAATYPLRRLADVLLAGFDDQSVFDNISDAEFDRLTRTWVDDKAIFSQSHSWPGDESWDNLLSATSLDANAFDSAITKMQQMNGPDGQPLELEPTHLVVGPANRSAAEDIIQKQLVSSGESNTHYQRVNLVVIKRFGSSTAWFVLDNDPVTSCVWQDREGPEFTAKDDPSDDEAFYEEKYAYKGRRRGEAAILAPWQIVGCKGA